YKPRQYGLSALDSLPFSDLDLAPLGQIGVGSGAEHDQSKSLTTGQLIPRFRVTNNSSGHHTGNLHHAQCSPLAVYDPEGILFVSAGSFFFVGCQKLPPLISYVRDLTLYRCSVDVHIEWRKKYTHPRCAIRQSRLPFDFCDTDYFTIRRRNNQTFTHRRLTLGVTKKSGNSDSD